MGLAHYNDFNFECCNDPFASKSISKEEVSYDTPSETVEKVFSPVSKYFILSTKV